MQVIRLLLIPTVIGFFICNSSFAQTSPEFWQNWPEIQLLHKKDKKPILINIYTTWCRYCKLMDKNTYNQDSVKGYLMNNYYRFRFNAESRDSIMFNGRMFRYNPVYKAHEFVLYLTQGNLAYPATIIIPADNNRKIFYELGALDTKQMEMILKYFTGKNLSHYNINDFARSFSSKW